MGRGSSVIGNQRRENSPGQHSNHYLYYSPPVPASGYPHYSPSLQFSDHLYHPYDEAASQLPLLTWFICTGLELGQQCIHVADDLPEERVLEALERSGVNTRAEMQDGALRFLGKWEWRRQEGLDLCLIARGLELLVSQGRKAGYRGTRLWADMTWALNPGVDPLQLEAWETLLHRVIQGKPAVAVCSYNRRRLPESLIKAGENAHPLRTAEGQVMPNERSRLPALFGKHANTLRCFEHPSSVRLIDPKY